MKILCVCDKGNNRSVHFAHNLKFWGNDCIPVGLETNSQETLLMLYDWADLIILTEECQWMSIPPPFDAKTKVFSVGPDIYGRPLNMALNTKVRKYLKDNEYLLKNEPKKT